MNRVSVDRTGEWVSEEDQVWLRRRVGEGRGRRKKTEWFEGGCFAM